MIPHIKLRARALQQQHRALFAAVFFFCAAISLFLFAGFAAGIAFLRGGWRLVAAGGCAFLLVWFRGVCSLGKALCFSALAGGRSVRFRFFLTAFGGRNLLRGFASFVLSGAAQLLLGALLCVPAGTSAVLLLRSLRRGLPLQTAVLFPLGTAAAVAVTVPALLRLHAAFLPRAFSLAEGSGVFESVRKCLQISRADLRAFLALSRSLAGWRALCLLLVPLPFVWGYSAQSRALLFSVMKLRPTP